MRPTDPSASPYRPDIDGLRAIAILAVVIFHASPSALPGGFVGVDIFFVISGYLISGIIFKSIQAGDLDFLRFYANRVRRIFPALILVLSACLIYGWFTLLAEEFQNLGKHVAGGAGFIENIILFREAGYFDSSSERKPLMHLWSLAIEEQFYLIYPVLLWAVWKMRFSLLAAVLAIGAVSFGINIARIEYHAVSTFFLLHSRMWELMAGGWLAYSTLQRNSPVVASYSVGSVPGQHPGVAPAMNTDRSRLDNLWSTLGLALMFSAAIFLDKDQRFPGWWALLPVIGALLIIKGGAGAWINRRWLAHPWMVFLGLISYPLYLWHWPILSFLRIVEGEVLSAALRAFAVALAALLAWMTFRFVEGPIRHGKRTFAGVMGLGLLLGLLFAAGVWVHRHNGLPSRAVQTGYGSRLPDVMHRHFFKYLGANFSPCQPQNILERSESHLGVIRCAQSSGGGEPTIAIIGDSHGEHLFIGLAENVAPPHGVVYYSFSCLPFFKWSGDPQCPHMNEALEYIAGNGSIKTVVMAASWPGKMRNPNFRAVEAPPTVQRGREFDWGLLQTLRKLAASGKRIAVLGDTPTFPFDPIKCLEGRPLSLSKDPRCDIPLADYVAQHQESWSRIATVVEQVPQARFISTRPFLCSDQRCTMKIDGKLMFRDNDHLSVDGSQLLGRKLVETMGTFLR